MNELPIIIVLNAATTIGSIVIGVKIVRHLSRIELKVDTMWDKFLQRIEHHGG